MVVCLNEIIDRLDFFRTPAFVTFKSKWFISSVMSKICSMIFIIFVIDRSIVNLNDFFKFENYNIADIYNNLSYN